MTVAAPAGWAPPTPGTGGTIAGTERVNPYVGPRALRVGEAIYGRTREIADIRGLLTAHRIVLLYSPSGAGKTSLIEAGLRPEMERRGFTVLPTIRVGHELTAAVPTARGAEHDGQNRYSSSVIASLEERLAPADQLTPEEVTAADLGDYLHRLADSDPERHWCLVLDQFEELFTMNPADVEAKEAFLKQLGAAVKDRRFWVLIAMREDYIAHLDPHVDLLPTRLKTRYRLDLLSPEAAKEAARAPALASGIDFEEAAVERLVDDLRQIRVQHLDETTVELGPHVEPLQLQIVCRRLWTSTTTAIRVGDLDNLGGVDEALTLYYEDALVRTVRRTSVRERTLRSWFEQQLITTDGFRRPVREGPGKSRGPAVLDELEEAYLIRKDRRNGTDWYELTHDRIVGPIRDSNRQYRSRRRRRRSRIGAIVAVIAVVAAVGVLVSLASDEARRLSASEVEIPAAPDVPVLEPGGFARYLIHPDEGDIVTATLTARGDLATSAKLRMVRVVDGELDAELALDTLRVVDVESGKGAEGTVPAADASGPDNVAVTQRAVTAEDGSIVVEVSTQSGGSFELEIDRVDAGAGGGGLGFAQLGPEPIDGRIETSGVVEDHSIPAGTGGAVRIVVSPVDDSDGGFDAVLTLDGGEEPIVQDESGPGQTEVLVTTLDADATYVVAVSGYESSTGDYTVRFEPVTTTELALGGGAMQGEVPGPGDVASYAFSLPDGGDVRVVVTPTVGADDGLDAKAILRDADGLEVAYADIGGPGQPEVLVATVEPDVEYLVEVSGYEYSTGAFEIAAATFATTPLPVGTDAVAGRITGDGEIVTYTVSDPEGGDVRLVVRPLDVSAAGLDPVVIVREPQIGAASVSDDGGAGETETLVAVMPAGTEFTVDVLGFEGSTGEFEVTLERISTVPLDLDVLAVGAIAAPEDVTHHAINIPADVEIDSFTVTPSGGLDVRVDLSTPFGNLPLDDALAGEAESIDWASYGVGGFPDDQRWLISVSSADGSVGEYEIVMTVTR